MTEDWDLVKVTYQMPHAGALDTEPYTQSSTKLNQSDEVPYITVGLLRNDPRLPLVLQNIQEQKNFAANVAANTIITDSLLNQFESMPVQKHPMACDVMSGYSGRLCRTCLPGFAKVNNKCTR